MYNYKLKTFVRYAIPSALATLMTGFYMTVDAIFVGKGVGEEALAAVNIINPIITLFAGAIILISAGGSTLISKNFGAEDNESAFSYFRQTLNVTFILSVLLTAIAIIFAGPIVRNLGGTEVIQAYTKEYLIVYMSFFIFNAAGISLGFLVRVDGGPILSMVAMMSGGISNIFLDYFFIMVLKKGIWGAAFATGISQCISLVIISSHFIKKSGKLRLSLEKIDLSKIKELSIIGIPVFMAEATYAFYVIFTNLAINIYQGDTGLSAFSIVNVVVGIINWIIFGLASGIMPIVSFSYGKKDFEEALYYVKACIVSCMITTFIFTAGAFLLETQIISFFTDSLEILELAKKGLLITLTAQGILGINLSISSYYQATEQHKKSNFICVMRVLIVYPIVLFGLSYLIKADGIYQSLLITEIICMIFLLKFMPIRDTFSKNHKKIIN